MSGAAIAIGAGIVLAILARRIPALWRDGLTTPVVEWYARRPIAGSAAVALLALPFYVWVARRIFNGHPLLIDEIVQVKQALIFAAGRLWLPSPQFPEFFSTLHMVESGGKVYSQFPPGGPAMLALGALVGAPWLVGPVCGALAVLANGAMVRLAEPRRAVALGATALFAFAPFTIFMSGSHMNHVPTLMWTLIAAASLAAVMASPSPRPWLAFAGGIGFGAAATIRPVDALAFALPAALWYLWRALRDRRRWADALASAAGVAIPMAVMMWVNWRTTGGPLLFGYEVLWGPGHGLGFHRAPWGLEHTPARGVELINVYFLRLERYLFETPVPSLVPVIGTLLLTRKLSAFDRYLLASASLLGVLYFAYWHDGFFLGPRFFFSLIPVLVLFAARFPALVAERFGRRDAYRVTIYAMVVSALVAVVYSIPLRGRQYTQSFAAERWDTPREAERAGVRNALVFVRESWESQMVVRLWALGISHTEGELLYRSVDACKLELAIGALEKSTLRGESAMRALLPLVADSSRIETRRLAGANVRVLPGSTYPARCAQRLREGQLGAMPLAPLMLVQGSGGNVYARDLHERDTLLLQRYPDRPVFLLRPEGRSARSRPRFYAAPRDSLYAAWAALRE